MYLIKKEYWFWLCNIPGIGVKKIDRLLMYYQEPEEIFGASEQSLKNHSGITEKDVQSILRNKNQDKIQVKYAKLKSEGIYFVTKEDTDYPKRLYHLPGAPFALYVKGILPQDEKPAIAIVGTRNCSAYGREMAIYFADELAKAGVQIISGLARGVDKAAHQGALQGNGLTFGILGSGIDICYPSEHINLYQNIIKTGGIISEYGMGIQPKPGMFPLRNRIISGLSDGILIIEAKEKSGSLITADQGLEQGKDIFALPGRVTDSLSLGCNNLIKMGAELIIKPSDILDYYLINYNQNVKEMKKNNKLLEREEKIVYANLSLVFGISQIA